MTVDQPNGLAIGSLATDRAAVVALQGLCNAADGVDIPLFLDMISEQVAAEASSGFYKNGELVGFALLPVNPGPEATIFVHPEHRRLGIGTALLDAMRGVARARGLERFIVVNDAASDSGTAFLAATGASYDESEYRLLLDPNRLDRSPRNHPDLALRLAGPDDVDTLIQVQSAAFGADETLVREAVLRAMANTKRQYHLGVLGDEPIGLLRTSIWDEEADITAFGVVPSHQSRGYGRQMLRDAIDQLLSAGQERISIEVATDNANALGLYQSCGFDVIAKFDYYDVDA
jgi:ribosomal protein S18 acetylase RimI-like enzyme